MKEARYYNPKEGGVVQCSLCPHNCRIAPGNTGFCRARKNISGRLMALGYGRISGLHMDPIEKKPLYRFFPGSRILSVGSFGCNFRCPWCQNEAISQCQPDTLPDPSGSAGDSQGLTRPEDIPEIARRQGSIGVAYTYNEPTVWFEYMMAIARLIKDAGMQNVVVSNGYINPAPLKELLQFTDAFNIDLKSFDHGFYTRYTNGRLQPVLDTLKAIAARGCHLEVTFLVIPGLNDDPGQFEDMAKWIAGHLGDQTVLHLNRYFPSRNFSTPPTPRDTLEDMKQIAGKYLLHTYLGNVG